MSCYIFHLKTPQFYSLPYIGRSSSLSVVVVVGLNQLPWTRDLFWSFERKSDALLVPIVTYFFKYVSSKWWLRFVCLEKLDGKPFHCTVNFPFRESSYIVVLYRISRVVDFFFVCPDFILIIFKNFFTTSNHLKKLSNK